MGREGVGKDAATGETQAPGCQGLAKRRGSRISPRRYSKEMGTYYIWICDAVGNVSEEAYVVEVINIEKAETL